MRDPISLDLSGFCRAIAAGHLLAYYDQEGDLGALTPDDPDRVEPLIGRLAEALERVVESFIAFEQDEPPTVFDLLARRVVGLPATAPEATQAGFAHEPPALVRDAARLEMRLEECAAEIMYAGLDDPALPSGASSGLIAGR